MGGAQPGCKPRNLYFQQSQIQMQDTQAEEWGEQPLAGLKLCLCRPLTIVPCRRSDCHSAGAFFCLLFLCLQAAMSLSNGDGVSGQITPSMM